MTWRVSDRRTDRRWRSRLRNGTWQDQPCVVRGSSPPLHAPPIPAERLPAPRQPRRVSHKVGSPAGANRITNPFVFATAYSATMAASVSSWSSSGNAINVLSGNRFQDARTKSDGGRYAIVHYGQLSQSAFTGRFKMLRWEDNGGRTPNDWYLMSIHAYLRL